MCYHLSLSSKKKSFIKSERAYIIRCLSTSDLISCELKGVKHVVFLFKNLFKEVFCIVFQKKMS